MNRINIRKFEGENILKFELVLVQKVNGLFYLS